MTRVCSTVRIGLALSALLALASCSDDDGKRPTTPAPATATSVSTATKQPSMTPTRTPASTATGTSTPTRTSSPTATPTETQQSPQAACDALQGRSIGGAEIRSAILVADASGYPEHCKVLGTIPPQLSFEVRLPTSWSGRALFIGGGGLDGIIFPPEALMFNPSIAADGYVTIATDAGHQGSPLDGAWALGDPLAVENFAYLSTHTVLAAARAIIEERYRVAPRRTYFFGNSTGGREGLIAAQRWPEDFDGIVALEPAYDMTALVLGGNRVAQHVFGTAGGNLSAGQLRTLGRAVLDACDELDGIRDGIISYLAACRFDPAVLRCNGAESDDCLTDEQIATVNTVHSDLELDFALANDVRSYPRWPLGNEDGAGSWPLWITGSGDPSSSLGFVLSDQTLRFFVAQDAQLDTLRFSPSSYADELFALSSLLDASDPDLTAFAVRGGKLILWHGWSDYAISAYSTIRYFERVVSTLGGRAAVDEFLRFYTSPGVDHLAGGPGAATTDFLAALVTWVEEGTPPGDLVSRKLDPQTAEPILARPLCRYPTYPRYEGKGDPAAASSFRCAAPD